MIFVLMLALGLSAFCATHRTNAAPILEVTQSAYLGLLPGDQFAIQFNVTNDSSTAFIVSYDFFATANVNEVFSIISQSLEEPVDQPLYGASFPYAVATSGGGNDFGAYNSTFTQGFGLGTSHAQTLVLSINPLASPGDYVLAFGWNFPGDAGPYLVDDNFNQYQMGSPISVTVSVIPEPSPGILFAVGLFILLGIKARGTARENSVS